MYLDAEPDEEIEFHSWIENIQGVGIWSANFALESSFMSRLKSGMSAIDMFAMP